MADKKKVTPPPKEDEWEDVAAESIKESPIENEWDDAELPSPSSQDNLGIDVQANTDPTGLPKGIDYGKIDGGNETLNLSEMAILKKYLDSSSPIDGKKDVFIYDVDLRSCKVDSKSGTQTMRANTQIVDEITVKDNCEHNRFKNQGIKVEVITKENGKTLVKVGPCDLSGIGGHVKREALIKDLVNNALRSSGSNKSFESVNVSACVGLRGRLRMLTDLFRFKSTILKNQGGHMNAYIKTDCEKNLTHWEPREGPQRFRNNTICAMVISVTTNLFEQEVMSQPKGAVYSSATATKEMLKDSKLKTIFNEILSVSKDKVKELVAGYKTMLAKIKDTPPAATTKIALKPPENTGGPNSTPIMKR